MSDIKLTCEETPLKWPASVALTDLTVSSTSALLVYAPQPGTLQVLTRRAAGGVGDGVTIEESASVGVDYRGQRFSLDESILHVPGLHIFPGQTAVYPAEYQIHLKTLSAPFRFITVVLPVSHKVSDLSGFGASVAEPYFAAVSAKPDPNAIRPVLTTLFHGTPDVLQYQGPELRGRTADTSGGCLSQNTDAIHQFLLVLQVARIRASDLERIPREGSMSTVPRDLPAMGVTATRTVAKDRLVRVVTLARPGLGGNGKSTTQPPLKGSVGAVECNPLGTSNGTNVLMDTSGNAVDVTVLLGGKMLGGAAAGAGAGAAGTAAGTAAGATAETELNAWMVAGIMFISMFIGLFVADDWIFSYVWIYFFSNETREPSIQPVKLVLFILLALSVSGLSSKIMSGLGLN